MATSQDTYFFPSHTCCAETIGRLRKAVTCA